MDPVTAITELHLCTILLAPTREEVLDDRIVIIKLLVQMGMKRRAALRFLLFHEIIDAYRFQ